MVIKKALVNMLGLTLLSCSGHAEEPQKEPKTMANYYTRQTLRSSCLKMKSSTAASGPDALTMACAISPATATICRSWCACALHQFLLYSQSYETDGVFHTKLCQETFAIPIYGLDAQMKLGGYLRIGQPVADQTQDVSLHIR